MNNFAENLRVLMAKKNINQVELAKMSGVSHQLISGYVNESNRGKYPSLPNLIALAKALNCTLEQLAGIEPLNRIQHDPGLSEQALEFARLWDKLPQTEQASIANLIKSLLKAGGSGV